MGMGQLVFLMVGHASYYSYRTVSVSERHTHIRAVVFHTLHRNIKNTQLCPYFVTFTMLARF